MREDYMPLYMELKLAIFVWLVHPDYLGAAYLWYGVVQPFHQKHLDQHIQTALGAMHMAKIPEAVKTKTMEVSNKDEEIEQMLKNKK